ncbi:MAG: helix-turn-helix domain-containing protein [Gammaproteobacteria bacterium]|nr:helix-turn-helix domain-containing protein [Gammaproteobacteria bacterium]
MKPQLIDTVKAAEYLDVKPNTLEGWRIQGKGPAYKKIGRLVRYTTDELNAYIDKQSRTSTSQVVRLSAPAGSNQ